MPPAGSVMPALDQLEVTVQRTSKLINDALAAGLTREFVELTRSAHKLKANAKQR